MIRILIAEDEEIIRSGLLYTIDWLSMNAVVVASAATGTEGLEKIKSLRPDIVITDIKMPGMSGLDMIAQAQNEKINFIPILLTSYSDFNYAKSAIALRVFDYLLKPVDEEKIKEILDLPEEYDVSCIIAVGHPEVIPAANERKPLKEVLTFR